jgi:hypothetical protein
VAMSLQFFVEPFIEFSDSSSFVFEIGFLGLPGFLFSYSFVFCVSISFSSSSSLSALSSRKKSTRSP